MKQVVEECKVELREDDAKEVLTKVSQQEVSTCKYKCLSAQRRRGVESLHYLQLFSLSSRRAS